MNTLQLLIKNPITFKVSYLAAIIGTLLLWLIGPTIIELSYHNKSWPVINNIIQGQHIHTLEHYQSIFSTLMVALSFIISVGILLSYYYYLAYISQKISHVFDNKLFTIALYVVIILISLYFFIVNHGNTYLNIATHDTFIFYEAIYRTSLGLTPHTDFHTPIGPVAYLLPYAGQAVQSSLAGSIEFASFSIAFILSLTIVYFCYVRTSALLTILAVLYFALIVIVPINVGTNGTQISHAMFYNNWSWAIVAVIFISYINPIKHSSWRLCLEAFLLATLLTILFYLKITYYLVAQAFFIILLLSSTYQRKLTLLTFIFTLTLVLIVEQKYQFTLPYLKDIYTTIKSSGAVRYGLLNDFIANSNEYILIVSSLFLLGRSVRWRDYLFVTYVATTGLAIINQNSQTNHIVTLFAILIWAHALFTQTETVKPNLQNRTHNTSKIFTILVLVFITPTIIFNLHAVINIHLAINQPQTKVTNLPNLYIGESKSFLDRLQDQSTPTELFNQLRHNRFKQAIAQGGEYIRTINQGVELLESQPKKPARIVNLDMASPFNFLTQATPPKNDYLWLHAGRNFSKKSHPKAETLFKDVDNVMHPHFPMTYETNQLLWTIYGSYIKEHYPIVSQSDYWTLYSKQ